MLLEPSQINTTV
jgi:hypothetical protein